MKQLLLALLFATGLTTAFSQTVNFGVKAGFNFSELAYKNSGELGNSSLTGFNAGGIVDISFANFSIQPGIFYSAKGENDSKEFAGASLENAGYLPSTTRLNYIEIPVNFFYKDKLSPAVTLNLGGGPYLASGISDKITVKTIPNNPYDHYPYRNPDYGINLIAGLAIKHNWLIDVGYGIGLQNLQSGGTLNNVHNRVISLSLGYLFK
jgi:hypothetical protein